MGEQSFREVREAFITTVLESVSHLGREQAEQRLPFIITGLWNELEATVKRMPAGLGASRKFELAPALLTRLQEAVTGGEAQNERREHGPGRARSLGGESPLRTQQGESFG